MLGAGELSPSPVLGPWPTSGGATAALDLAGRVFVGLAIFVAADLDYQSALVFYNALLPGVAAGRGLDKRRGEHRHRQYDPLRAGGVRDGSGWTARR
jgi:hypothetical protein